MKFNIKFLTVRNQVSTTFILLFLVFSFVLLALYYFAIIQIAQKSVIDEIYSKVENLQKDATFEIEKSLLDLDNLHMYFSSDVSDHANYRMSNYDRLLNAYFSKTLNVNSISTVWEPGRFSSLNGTITDSIDFRMLFYRRIYRSYFSIKNDSIPPDEGILKSQDWYNDTYALRKPTIQEPVLSKSAELGDAQVLETIISAPLIKNLELYCLTAMELDISAWLAQLIKLNEQSNVQYTIVSSNGTFIYHPQAENLTKPVSAVYPELNNDAKFLEYLAKGIHAERSLSINNEEISVINFPVKFKPTNNFWNITVFMPVELYTTIVWQKMQIALFIWFLFLFIFGVGIIYIVRSITAGIGAVRFVAGKFASGDLKEISKVRINTRRFSEDIDSVLKDLDFLATELVEISRFADEIGKGNYKSDLVIRGKKDLLSNSLINMRENLIEAKRNELFQVEKEAHNNWITGGIAKFAVILQQNAANLDGMTYQIISELVKYLDAEMGAFFVRLKDENQRDVIVLKAAYAYNKQKFLETEIIPGEGIIGTVAVEKEMIYLKKVPDNYIQISSGLGGAKPNVLVAFPLISNNELYGIIEIAGFNPLSDDQIAFLGNLSKNVASALATAQTSFNQNNLVQKYESISDSLQQKVSENALLINELDSLKTSSNKVNAEYYFLLNAIDKYIYRASINEQGIIIQINRIFADLLQQIPSLLIGSSYGNGLRTNDFVLSSYLSQFSPNEKAEALFFDAEINSESHMTLRQVVVPIYSRDQEWIRFDVIAYDIQSETELKKKYFELSSKYTQENTLFNEQNSVLQLKIDTLQLDIQLLMQEKKALTEKLNRRLGGNY